MSIAENIAAVRQQMDQAARETGRTGADVILVGASKMSNCRRDRRPGRKPGAGDDRQAGGKRL